MRKAICTIALAFSISACTVVPKQIQVAEDTPLVPFEQVITNTNATNSIGEKARWGGKIVSVQNREELSEIEVVYFPESSNGKPRTGEESSGRFKALVPGFVDPLVFEQNRLITIIGNITEPAEGIIGEQSYTYPTLNAVGYYMWQQSTEVEVRNVGYQPFLYGYGSPFYRGGYHSWYRPWGYGYGFQRSRVRVTSHNGHSQGGRVERPNSSNNTTTRTNTNRTTRPSVIAPSPRTPTPSLQEK